MTTATKTAAYKTESGKSVEISITAERGVATDKGTVDGVASYSLDRLHERDTVEVIVDGESKLTTDYQVRDITNNKAASALRKAGYVAALFRAGQPVVGFTADQRDAVDAAYKSAVAEAAGDDDYKTYLDRSERTTDAAINDAARKAKINRAQGE